jgi:hypothetical protein
VADVPQPPQPTGKLQISSDLGRLMTEELVAQTQLTIPAAKVDRLTAAPAGSEGLVVACHFSKLQPGSRGKRFWLSFGAGKSILELSGEVRERQGDRLVARFTHARASWCCGFGNNDTEIRNNLVEVARDIAGVVSGRFAEDQEYQTLAEEPPTTQPSRDPPPAIPTGMLVVDSNPAHADVEMDGKYLGTTPLEVQLPRGEHTVLVRKAGFLDWSRTLSVIAGGKQGILAELAAPQRK